MTTGETALPRAAAGSRDIIKGLMRKPLSVEKDGAEKATNEMVVKSPNPIPS